MSKTFTLFQLFVRPLVRPTEVPYVPIVQKPDWRAYKEALARISDKFPKEDVDDNIGCAFQNCMNIGRIAVYKAVCLYGSGMTINRFCSSVCRQSRRRPGNRCWLYGCGGCRWC